MAHLAMNIVSNGGGHSTTSAAAAAMAAVDPAAVAALQDDVAELKNRLAARDRSVCHCLMGQMNYTILLRFWGHSNWIYTEMG